MLSKDVINFEGKKILIRPSQAETTRGKNIIIDESREKTRSTIKKSKPTFDELLAKYKKDDAHTKIGKHRIFRRSNRSFQFPHVRPMF
jgi:hypothetical protein